MSRTENAMGRKQQLVIALLVVLVGSIFAGYYPHDPGTAWGALVGGLVGFVAIVGWSKYRRGTENSYLREAQGEADERDRAVNQEAWAIVGQSSFVVIALGMVAMVWDVKPLHVLTAMLWVLVALFFASNAWLSRNR